MIRFDMQRDEKPIIKVIGVGGGGGNAVNHMFNQGIKGVDFVICNTDVQSLNLSPIPAKIQLGASLTEGRGAGSLPSVGKNAALENIEDIQQVLTDNTRMLFITAGMGGGTGTGAAPVIASVARELNILTVGIVTLPFNFEGSKRRKQAEEGIRELREHVDSLLVINNDKLRELYGDLPLSKAFSQADNILTTAAKGIAEIITVTGYINVDFEDVKTVMKDSGVAIMGTGIAEGEERALIAVESALTSPLLNDNNIEGAGNILLYIASSTQEVTMDEVTTITDFIQAKAGLNAEIIWGTGTDESLGNAVSVTLVATGFEVNGGERKGQKSQEAATILVGAIGDAPVDPDQPLRKNPPMPLYPEEPVQEVTAEPLSTANLTPGPAPEPLPDEAARETVFENFMPMPDDEGLEEETEDTDAPETFGMHQQADTPDALPDQEPDMALFTFSTEEIQDTLNELEINQDELPREEEAAKQAAPAPAYTFTPPAAMAGNRSDIPSLADRDKTSNDRISKLKELSLRLKTPEGVDQLEKEPAFLRQKVELNETRHSSESEVSQFSVTTDSKGGIELRQNNSYIHGRPD